MEGKIAWGWRFRHLNQLLLSFRQPHHSPPHHAVLCALEPADMCGYDAERGVYSDGTRMSLLPLPGNCVPALCLKVQID